MDIRKGSRLSVKPLEDLHVVPVELFLKTGRVLASPVSFLHAGPETFVKLRRVVRLCRHQASLVTTDSSRRGYPSGDRRRLIAELPVIEPCATVDDPIRES
jgi:hypothetical protein